MQIKIIEKTLFLILSKPATIATDGREMDCY